MDRKNDMASKSMGLADERCWSEATEVTRLLPHAQGRFRKPSFFPSSIYGREGSREICAANKGMEIIDGGPVGTAPLTNEV